MPEKKTTPGARPDNAAQEARRQVKAPGSAGGARPVGRAGDAPARPTPVHRQAAPAAPPRPQAPRPDPDAARAQEFRDTYGFDPPPEFAESWKRARAAAEAGRAGAAPGAPGQSAARRPGGSRDAARAAARPPLTEAQARAAARRARERRRARRRLTLLGTFAGILVLAAGITLLLPKKTVSPEASTAEQATAALSQSAVAPVPYAGGAAGGGADAAQPDWGAVGPVRQTENYTYTAAPAADAGPTLPEFGKVDTTWFADAAFLGDSLTAGISVYGVNVGGALVCGYEGTSPNQIVNRTVLDNDERGQEIPLDVLGAAQPAKLYVLLGTNALVGTGNDEGFLNYYGLMLDALQQTLPNTKLYVQSVLPTRPEALDSAPGLAPDRLAAINEGIRQLCAQKGCYYLDLSAGMRGDDGYLAEDIAQTDGIHLTVAGYSRWVAYLCAHVPYNKNNPYQSGSTWYLTDAMKQLLADLP